MCIEEMIDNTKPFTFMMKVNLIGNGINSQFTEIKLADESITNLKLGL